jgi:hypothetical protein
VVALTRTEHAPADDAAPDAPARFVAPNALVVAACPFCGKRHVHGAGAPAPGTLPRPEMYGYRGAHCHQGTYRLVAAGRQP